MERSGRFFITFLEGKQSCFQFGQRFEIIGGENLTLNDGEVDLDLVEPTRVNGRVNRNDRRPADLKTLDALLAAVSGAIIVRDVALDGDATDRQAGPSSRPCFRVIQNTRAADR